MPPAPLKLIVLTGSDRPEVLKAWDSLLPLMRDTDGVEVVGTFARQDDIPADHGADIVVVIGGDGSILRGCRQLGDRQLPIAGINLGRLGFLADITVEDFCGNLRQLCDGDYSISEHLMFRCEHHSEGRVSSDLGLNEVTVTAAGSLKMLDINLAIDDEPITTFSCDGLIVSTPVGSTAHNLSAGGPILRQDLQAFCITPICPHTLTIRPIVDSAERTYELTVANPPEGVTLVIDGQISRPIREGDRIVVKRAEATFKLIRFSGHSYYNTLHRKLGWRGQLDYRERR